MIPRTIQIQNFLSYGSPLQTINFQPYNLICLSGKNGHGKSALLDALTWALWGQARKVTATSRPDQGLLRLGQSKMMVIYDFELGNTLYRVKRSFEILYNKPYLSLEFGICINADSFEALTEKTIRDTQARIDKTIGFTFDTFVNSAFLRQGNANEFSKRSPKERKDIIVSILGLGTYETLRKAAQEKIRQATLNKQLLVTLQNHRLETLQDWDRIKQEQTAVQLDLAQLDIQHTTMLDKFSVLHTESTHLNQQIQIRSTHLLEHKNLTETVQKKIDELHMQRATWRSLHYHQLTTSPHRNQYEKKRTELATTIDQFQRTRHEQLFLKEQILHAQEHVQRHRQALAQEQHKQQQEISAQTERLRMEHEHHANRLTELHQQEQELLEKLQNNHTTIEVLRTTLATHASLSYDILVITTRFEKYKATYQQWTALGNMLHSTYAVATQKLSWQDAHNPSCPLCEQNLSIARKKFLHAKFTQEAQRVGHKLARLKRIIPKLKELLVAENIQLAEWQRKEAEYAHTQIMLEKEIHTQQELIQQKITTENQKNILKTKQVHIEQELQKSAERMHAIATHTHIQTLTTHLKAQESAFAELTVKLHAIIYNQHAHEQALAEQQMIDTILTTDLKIDGISQQDCKQKIHTLCFYIKDTQRTIASLGDALRQSETLETQKKQLESQTMALNTAAAQLTEQRETLIHKKGILNAQHTRLSTIHEEYIREQKAVDELDTTITDYTIIAHASSKDGIQALLIEDALPEIEHEANSLLAKLTHNNAHIMIESVRDLKKGGTKETLDIKISDASGIRPYELFSGGEAFRIDFALRIAISKLLARRAGTALQTLIIDEGFGSQDDEGLSLIMDALYAIQDDFAKVIIVSHLPAMKDQFPVHFVVEKSAGSSIVSVLEQG